MLNRQATKLSLLVLLLMSVPARPEPAALDRGTTLVLGASVSAGYGVGRNANRLVDLARTLEACWGTTGDVQSLATPYFRQAPLQVARDQVQQARTHHPDLVVAVDFLFWLAYGSADGPHDRTNRVHSGLRLLEGLGASVLLGTLPLLQSNDSRCLREAEIPSAEFLEELNREILDFADRHARIHVLRLDRLYPDAADEPEENGLLQADGLHPTWAGLTSLAHAVTDELNRHQLGPRRRSSDAAGADLARIVPEPRRDVPPNWRDLPVDVEELFQRGG